MRSHRFLNHPPWLAVVSIVLVTLAAYANGLTGAFILDDVPSVTQNPSVRQLWPLTAPPAGAPTGGRPVANFTFAVNYAMSGAEVWSYHATNIAVHALAALALFGIVRRTFLRPVLDVRFREYATPLAWMVAVLWAVHPVQTATVDYVSQRTEQLMGLFYLLTLYGFIRASESKGWHWLALAITACALGMGSKEVMVTAPLLVFLYDRTFLAGSFRAAWQQRGRQHLALAATWVLLAWLMLTSNLTQRGAGFGVGVSPLTYALTESRVVMRYLGLSMWPHPLIFDYGWYFAWSLAEVWPFVLGIVALAGGVGWALWRRPVVGFLGAWFLVILAPTSSFVPVNQQPMAESRLYLPLAAVAVTLVVTGFTLLRTRAFAVLGLLVALGAGLTLRRTTTYQTEVGIWADTVAKQPLNPRAHRTLGDSLLLVGRTDEGIASLETAIRLKPDYAQAHYNLGSAYLIRGNAQFARGDLAATIAAFETALRLDPTHAKAHNNLGNALVAAQRSLEAIPHYEAALRFKADFPEAKKNLAMAYTNTGAAHLAAGQIAAALAAFRQARELDPENAERWYNLSSALLTAGDTAEAIKTGRGAIQLAPQQSTFRIHLGNALFQANQVNEAAASYVEALRIAPDNAEAHNNLGVILLRGGRPAEAREHFMTALRLRPDYADARANLALVPPVTP